MLLDFTHHSIKLYMIAYNEALTCKELIKSKKMAAKILTLAVSPINQATPNIGKSKRTLRMPTLLEKKEDYINHEF